MTLRDDINAMTPRLRRYARALSTGSHARSSLADDVVHATLMRALGARQIGSSADLTVRLFATVTQLHREMLVGGQARATGSGRPALVSSRAGYAGVAFDPPIQTKLSTGLSLLAIEDREALLLVALEGFDHAEAARILRISRTVLIGRLTQARTTLDAHLRARPAPVARRRDAPHLRVVK